MLKAIYTKDLSQEASISAALVPISGWKRRFAGQTQYGRVHSGSMGPINRSWAANGRDFFIISLVDKYTEYL